MTKSWVNLFAVAIMSCVSETGVAQLKPPAQPMGLNCSPGSKVERVDGTDGGWSVACKHPITGKNEGLMVKWNKDGKKVFEGHFSEGRLVREDIFDDQGRTMVQKIYDQTGAVRSEMYIHPVTGAKRSIQRMGPAMNIRHFDKDGKPISQEKFDEMAREVDKKQKAGAR